MPVSPLWFWLPSPSFMPLFPPRDQTLPLALRTRETPWEWSVFQFSQNTSERSTGGEEPFFSWRAVTAHLSICISLLKEPSKRRASHRIAKLQDKEEQNEEQPLLPNHQSVTAPQRESECAFSGHGFDSLVAELHSVDDVRRHSILPATDSQRSKYKQAATKYPGELSDVCSGSKTLLTENCTPRRRSEDRDTIALVEPMNASNSIDSISHI